MNTALQARPYRSHRVPACDKCRKRKIRCKIEVPGQPCELCAEKGVDCLFSGSENVTPRRPIASSNVTPSTRPRKRPRLQDTPSTSISESRRPHTIPAGGVSAGVHSSDQRPATAPTQNTRLTVTSSSSQRHGSHGASANTGESSIVVGPMVAEDVRILQQYLTTEPETDPHSRQPYNVISNTPGNPVIYLAVPTRGESSKLAKDPGHEQREILEQILGPKRQDVIQLYFKHIHPAFPVLDEEAFLERDGRSVSSSLFCEVYSIALTFWHASDTLKNHHCPSEQYFWNLAIAALQEDFLAPRLSTLYPSLVDLLGRPVGSVQGNVVNTGRAVALAYSLGLNRDPGAWKIPDKDKDMRIRLFWGCMILDQWYGNGPVRAALLFIDNIRSSFAHGIPSSILRRHYDVPLPSISALMTPGIEIEERFKAAECFLQLCKLSQILGDILPFVYDLGEPCKSIWKELRRLECDLDEWEDNLPEYLQIDAIEDGTSVSGASSLRLGYLSVKMLLCRVSLRAAAYENVPDSSDIRQYHMATLRRAATCIAEFVVSLRSSQLREFWLSFTGHLLVFAATVLLRCAIDTTDATLSGGCKDSLRSLQNRLHLAKTQDDWDLADMFIKRCDEPISRIIAISDSCVGERGTTQAVQDLENCQRQPVSQETVDLSSAAYSEFNILGGPLDCPWESLWDMLEGP